MTQNFDAIVLGAGAMGSAAAYYLAKQKQRVLLLEQFELNHQKGSSYGESRAIRYMNNHPIYINLMRSAYPLWFALEEEAKEKLYVKTGGLDISQPEQPSFQAMYKSADEAKLDYEYLTGVEVRKRFPQFYPDEEMHALYHPDSGYLRASRCVLAHTRLAQKLGATLIDQTPVTSILTLESGVTVQTVKESYTADRLVLSAGSWASALLAQMQLNLPLSVMPIQLAFFEATPHEEFVSDRFPVFYFHIQDDYGEMPYGIAADSGKGIKISPFYGYETVSSPSQVDYTPSQKWIEQIRQFARRYIPGADGPLISTRRCLYTMTPDKHFIIDSHPDYPHVVIAAGFSGHGFKFSTLVGKILADLALEGKTEHDTSLFKLSRFQ
ncbi:MAG: N-methyl-L-tryptophan oxidase [Tolypothrix carrinoi HA7290-LM1]|jgi:monomeric sarcosine oxidase|nr:N-methyl-L-tryptophan oxidase [Tolypothrix carrinoi HA7290-LM1]